MWGEFRKNELVKTSCESRQERTFDQEIKTTIKEKEEMVLSVDNSENSSGSMLHEHDFVQSFDIGKYIWEALTATPPRSGEKNEKKHYERTPSTVNPASSQIVQRHGKDLLFTLTLLTVCIMVIMTTQCLKLQVLV